MTLHRGKLARPPTILNVRALTRDDLMLLRQEAEGGTIKPLQGAVQRLRDPHHRVARLFASGLRMEEVVVRSGYSYSRVHTLNRDPAFQELIAKYRDKVDAAFVREADTYYELATANMVTAERMISEKLEEHDENGTLPPVRELLAISRDAGDRFGYGKRQTNLNINADFAAMLEAARNRSAKAKTIEVTVVPPEQPSLQSQPMKVVPAAPSAGHPSLPLIRRRA